MPRRRGVSYWLTPGRPTTWVRAPLSTVVARPGSGVDDGDEDRAEKLEPIDASPSGEVATAR